MSDRWDWWNTDKQLATKPKDWQPLTPEEEAKVVHLPSGRRCQGVRMVDARSWQDMSRERLQNARNAGLAKGAGRLDFGAEPREVHSARHRVTHAEMVQILQEMTRYYGGNIPSVAQIKLYRESFPATPTYKEMIRALGPKTTWPRILEQAKAQSD